MQDIIGIVLIVMAGVIATRAGLQKETDDAVPN
jgi:hypothetical protein